MTQELPLSQWVVLAWFTCAVLAEVLSTIAFAIWLRRRKVGLIFGMMGIPGYLERRYAEWCRANGRSSRNWIVVRWLLMANVVAALVVAFPIFVGA
jgi:hypothetical protein